MPDKRKPPPKSTEHPPPIAVAPGEVWVDPNLRRIMSGEASEKLFSSSAPPAEGSGNPMIDLADAALSTTPRQRRRKTDPK